MIDFTNMRDGCYAFIISAQRPCADRKANEDARRGLRRTLAVHLGGIVIGFLPCQGCYKGEREPSFLVFVNERAGNLPHELRRQFHQESVLIIDRYGEGHLHFTKGPEFVGEADWTSREIAEREHDAYTIIEGFNDALVFE